MAYMGVFANFAVYEAQRSIFIQIYIWELSCSKPLAFCVETTIYLCVLPWYLVYACTSLFPVYWFPTYLSISGLHMAPSSPASLPPCACDSGAQIWLNKKAWNTHPLKSSKSMCTTKSETAWRPLVCHPPSLTGGEGSYCFSADMSSGYKASSDLVQACVRQLWCL